MTKFSLREFGLASSGEEGLRPYLNRHGAFIGQGTPLLREDARGQFAPLAQRDLEIALSAGFGVAVDLGSRMRGLAAIAKALNQGDYALAAILLTQKQLSVLPDREGARRMQKAAGSTCLSKSTLL